MSIFASGKPLAGMRDVQCWLQVSDDGERSVLVKLKTECGYQFTSKLESMFTDIKTSRDMMQEYKNQQRADGGASTSDVDLSVQVPFTIQIVLPEAQCGRSLDGVGHHPLYALCLRRDTLQYPISSGVGTAP